VFVVMVTPECAPAAKAGAVRCTVWFGHANGRKCLFVEPHAAANFFGRDRLYGMAAIPSGSPSSPRRLSSSCA
jgi:hypothetical protein